jgi:uroporphyrin-III C-methyltransferase
MRRAAGDSRLHERVTGTVHFVGAGPGSPDLLTLRAARLLERADLVLYDALVHPETLALAARAAHVDVGKRAGSHSTAQRFIDRRLVEAARKHAIVVRLKGGDPMLFGRLREEIDALDEAGVAWEIVPGVSAAFGAAADLGVSLTERGVSRSVLFVTPRFGDGEHAHDWIRAAAAADTTVIYMARGQAPDVQGALVAAGREPATPIALVENATRGDARVVLGRLDALGTLAAALGSGPALIVIGAVLRDRVAATERARALATEARTRYA